MAIARIDAYRTVAFGSITNSFTAVGAPTAHQWSLFDIVNNTDGDMIFSVDGTTNNLFVPANSFVLYDLSANSSPVNVNGALLLQVGTQFYVKYSTAPTKGAVYVEGTYAQGF